MIIDNLYLYDNLNSQQWRSFNSIIPIKIYDNL